MAKAKCKLAISCPHLRSFFFQKVVPGNLNNQWLNGCFNGMMNQIFTWEMVVSNHHFHPLKKGLFGFQVKETFLTLACYSWFLHEKNKDTHGWHPRRLLKIQTFWLQLQDLKTLPEISFWAEPGSDQLVVLGMAIPPLIGNPYNSWVYKPPLNWVDDHPLLYGNIWWDFLTKFLFASPCWYFKINYDT